MNLVETIDGKIELVETHVSRIAREHGADAFERGLNNGQTIAWEMALRYLRELRESAAMAKPATRLIASDSVEFATLYKASMGWQGSEESCMARDDEQTAALVVEQTRDYAEMGR